MWDGRRVAYICAVYFGRPTSRRYIGSPNGHRSPRSNHLVKACLADEYLPAIARNATCLDKVILVCSVEEGQQACLLALENKAADFQLKTGIPTLVCSKANPGHWSYGGWDLALRLHCDGINFAFLVEDDYIPCKVGFDEELLHRYYRTSKDRSSILCCVSHWRYDHKWGPHAAVSNGLMNVDLFNEHGGSFSLLPGSKNAGEETQTQYLLNFSRKGLSIRNMSSDYCIPYMMSTAGRIQYLGEARRASIIFAPVEMDSDRIRVHQEVADRAVPPFRARESGGFDILEGE